MYRSIAEIELYIAKDYQVGGSGHVQSCIYSGRVLIIARLYNYSHFDITKKYSVSGFLW